ncbi:MAG TPA: LysR family transcriptional regulator [Verrucomicrobiae bacterium]
MKKKSASTSSTSLQPRFRIMSGKEIAFGPGKAELLQFVAETGSIGKAASHMNMSYMRAWSLIRTMNACFKKPVITALRGGRRHGGAELTETGRRVLESYRQMEKAGSKAAQTDWRALQKLLRR